MGTAVNGGMITATVLAIFFVPVFFVVVRKLFPVKERTSSAGVPVEPAVETL
jgi:Cu/Ag efflux pump CusA